MATPTKFTPDTRAKIIECIASGMTRHRACATAGISRKTLHTWERQAAEDPAFEEFVEAMQLAQDMAEGKLEAIHTAIATNGDTYGGVDLKTYDHVKLRALQFQLQCGGSRPWAEKTQLEVTGKDGGPLEFAEKATTRIGDALAKMAQRFQKSAPEPTAKS